VRARIAAELGAQRQQDADAPAPYGHEREEAEICGHRLGASERLALVPRRVDSLPGPEHASILGALITTYDVRGNLVPDAFLAALAIEHGLTLYSADTDFAPLPRTALAQPRPLTSNTAEFPWLRDVLRTDRRLHSDVLLAA
jgi:hypothetical protein